MSTARTTTPPTDAPRQPSPEVAALDLLRRDEEIAVGALVSSAWREDADAVRLLRDTLGDGSAIQTLDLRRYWRATGAAIDAGEGASNPAILDRLKDPTSEDIERMQDCVEACLVPMTDGLASARKVRDAGVKRSIEPSARYLHELCLNGSTADELAEAIDAITSTRSSLSTSETRQIIAVADLIEQNPALNRIIIDGLLRSCEVMNLVAAPKVGKSWLVYSIALCVAFGLNLWDAFACTAGRVLVIDNELHKPTLASRIKRVAKSMGLDLNDCGDRLDVMSLRGQRAPVDEIRRRIRGRQYDLVILDALYRALPQGVAENSNEGMADVYCELVALAESMGAAVVVVHHSSKGNQADKAVTDVGSGAGSQSRATDTHLILREHEEPGHVVVDAAVRSFAPVATLVLRWNFPLWEPAYLENPEALKGRKTKGEQRQDDRDREGMQTIVDAVSDGPLTARRIRETTGISKDRCERLVGRLVNEGELTGKPTTVRGNPTTEYHHAL